AIPRELRVQPLARPARLASADAVREDDEMRRGVERLPSLKQLATEVAREESAAVAGGAVQDEHRVSHDAARIPFGLAKRRVMDAQDGQGRPVAELEVAHLEVSFNSAGGSLGIEACCEQKSDERASRLRHKSPF